MYVVTTLTLLSIAITIIIINTQCVTIIHYVFIMVISEILVIHAPPTDAVIDFGSERHLPQREVDALQVRGRAIALRTVVPNGRESAYIADMLPRTTLRTQNRMKQKILLRRRIAANSGRFTLANDIQGAFIVAKAAVAHMRWIKRCAPIVLA